MMINKNDQAVACLTLRQYYAAAAMQGELAYSKPDENPWLENQFSMLAERCFKIADAMIEFENKEDK